ncbi:MAG: PDZ domain-containing protein, partial [Mesorhizobium sp.]
RTAERFGLPTSPKGVVAIDIAPNSTAARVGFRPGDVILAVNGTSIDTPETLRSVAAEQTRRWRFTVLREGRQFTQSLIY